MPKWLLKNYLCMCLWGCLWERLAFESVDWVKKIVLTIWWASHSPSGAWIEQKHRGRVYSLFPWAETSYPDSDIGVSYVHTYIYIYLLLALFFWRTLVNTSLYLFFFCATYDSWILYSWHNHIHEPKILYIFGDIPKIVKMKVKWSESCSVVSDSLQPHGLYSPWNSLGQNTGVGSHSLLQWIFPTQEWNRGLMHCWWILYQLSYMGNPLRGKYKSKQNKIKTSHRSCKLYPQ